MHRVKGATIMNSRPVTVSAAASRLAGPPMLAPEILMPGVVLTALWPLLRVAVERETDAFLLAFLVTVALRLAIKADVLILSARSHLGPRAAILATLAVGPGLLTFLMLNGDPTWCQRFLSGYSLLMAALFLLDLIDGKGHLARYNWPEVTAPQARRILGQVMVLNHLGMFLTNEVLIRSAGYGNWLIFLGYAPLISHLIVQSTLGILRERTSRVKTG